MKKTYAARKRYTGRRRKAYRRRRPSGKYARRMQKSSYNFVSKKYVRTYLLPAGANSDMAYTTVSLIGGKNQQAPNFTLTLNDNNQNDNIQDDMALHQQFKITGVSCKLFFSQNFSVDQTPLQWSMCYSPNLVLAPELSPPAMQSLASYQTGPCNPQKSVSRYFRTAKALNRLGIEWCQTREFGQFAGANELYGGQLPINSGSSLNIKVFRTNTANPVDALCRLEVTYYVKYSGTRAAVNLVQV